MLGFSAVQGSIRQEEPRTCLFRALSSNALHSFQVQESIKRRVQTGQRGGGSESSGLRSRPYSRDGLCASQMVHIFAGHVLLCSWLFAICYFHLHILLFGILSSFRFRQSVKMPELRPKCQKADLLLYIRRAVRRYCKRSEYAKHCCLRATAMYEYCTPTRTVQYAWGLRIEAVL